MEIIPTENENIISFMRTHAGQRAVIFANFSEHPQPVEARILEQYAVYTKKLRHGNSKLPQQGDVIIKPLDFLVFG